MAWTDTRWCVSASAAPSAVDLTDSWRRASDLSLCWSWQQLPIEMRWPPKNRRQQCQQYITRLTHRRFGPAFAVSLGRRKICRKNAHTPPTYIEHYAANIIPLTDVQETCCTSDTLSCAFILFRFLAQNRTQACTSTCMNCIKIWLKKLVVVCKFLERVSRVLYAA